MATERVEEGRRTREMASPRAQRRDAGTFVNCHHPVMTEEHNGVRRSLQRGRLISGSDLLGSDRSFNCSGVFRGGTLGTDVYTS